MIYNKRGQKVDVGSCSYVVGNNITGSNEYKGMAGVIVNIKVSDDNTMLDVLFKFPDGSYKTREVRTEMIECA